MLRLLVAQAPGTQGPLTLGSLPTSKPEGSLHSSPTGPGNSKGSALPAAEEDEGERALLEKVLSSS
jgi:hypothetical protein